MLWARINDEAMVVNLKFHRKFPLFPTKLWSEAFINAEKYRTRQTWITTHNYNILLKLILFDAIKIHMTSTTQNKLLTSDA